MLSNEKIASFLESLGDAIEVPSQSLSKETELDSIAWVSLAVISCIALADEHFGVTLSGEELHQAINIQEIIDLISKKFWIKISDEKQIKTSNKIEIAGVVSCLPKRKIENSDIDEFFTKEEIRKVCDSIGVNYRYQVKDEINTSDLCLAAAKHLISKLKWETNSIDGIILLTQTPDFKLPASAFKIHKLLGLKSDTFAFDVNLGCSAYPYGLWLASSLMQTGPKRILLMVGDTIVKL